MSIRKIMSPLTLLGSAVLLMGTACDKFPLPAPRPSYSVLGHNRWAAAGLVPMARWDDSLTQALSRPGFAELRPASQGPAF